MDISDDEIGGWSNAKVAQELLSCSEDFRKKMLKIVWKQIKEGKRSEADLHNQLPHAGQAFLYGYKVAMEEAVDVKDKVEWRPDYAADTIPKFSEKTNAFFPIEEWACRVQRNLAHFSGPDLLKVMAITKAVDFFDDSDPDLDLGSYTVHNFLLLLVKLWNEKHSEEHIPIQIVKNPTESWNDYYLKLKTWVKTTHVAVNDGWYLAHFRAHIRYGEDPYTNKSVSPKEWANRMDELETRYARAEVSESSMTDVVARKTASDSEDEDDSDGDRVNRIQHKPYRFQKKKRNGMRKHQFTSDHTPICDKCHKPGHIARNCPYNKHFSDAKSGHYSHYSKSIVYAIEDKASKPLVIRVSVNKSEINAMLDCGAMENVIDINVLRKIAPRTKLKYFGRKLIGADKKPIVVCGAAWLPVRVGNHRTSLHCVAVENLNTKLIIGLPGLKHLGLSADFGTRTVRMGNTTINAIGELAGETESVNNIEVDIDKDLTPSQQEQLREITDRWRNTLVETIQDRGPAKGYKFSIDTGDTKPIYVPLRTYSPKEQEELDKQIDEMLQKHIITRTRSPWSAPVLLVKKKDNSYRVVVDYTKLNAKTADDPYPLPIPRTAFQVLNEARYYSSLDLASGYWQVEVAKKDIQKTAFNTRKGTFAYLRMPMGLKGAPSAFQRFMSEIFSDLLYHGVLVFIDDILIYSENWKQHLKLVNEVLKRLSDHNLQAKVGKCHFGAKEVKYLGSIISHGGRKPDPDKVKAIRELQPPRSKEDIRSLLGLVGFYREFIKDLSVLTEPIQKLMKKEVEFVWGVEQQKAFDTIKKSISEKSCLEFPNPKWKYELHTDASLEGIGAVLFQKDPSGKLHTIEFASKSLSKAQRKQAIPVLECYAIVWALKKFRCYVHGSHVDIYTDHYGLQYMKKKKDPPAQIQRWWWDIADYDFDIYYKQGKKNIADPLSRLMPQDQLDKEDSKDMELLNAIDKDVRKHTKVVEILERRTRGLRREYLVRWDNVKGPLTWESRYAIRNHAMVNRFDQQWDAKERQQEEQKLKEKRLEMSQESVIQAQLNDPFCQEIRKALNNEETSAYVKSDAAQCVELEGRLYHKDNRRKSSDGQLQLVVPEEFRRKLVEEIHGGVLGGHFGLNRTMDAVRRHYWWHGMKDDIEEIIKGCPKCNARNPVRGEKRPLLQPEERVGRPWERVGIDYTDMTLSRDGYSKILVMIDHATKFVIAKATKDGSAETAARILFEELICKYGSPMELWSDRGKSFIGELTRYLANLFQIKQKFTSGYHPQTNGLTERFNRTITAELAKAVNEDKDNWPSLLPAKVFAYNTTVQKSTGYSPFELIHTFYPRLPLDNELALPSEDMRRKDWAMEMHKRAEIMRKDALESQQSAAEAQKRYHDEGLEPENFEIGDLVRVYDQTAEASKPMKLRNLWIGPYRIRGRKGMLFEIEDMKGAEVKGLFHPIKLKKVNEERAYVLDTDSDMK